MVSTRTFRGIFEFADDAFEKAVSSTKKLVGTRPRANARSAVSAPKSVRSDTPINTGKNKQAQKTKVGQASQTMSNKKLQDTASPNTAPGKMSQLGGSAGSGLVKFGVGGALGATALGSGIGLGSYVGGEGIGAGVKAVDEAIEDVRATFGLPTDRSRSYYEETVITKDLAGDNGYSGSGGGMSGSSSSTENNTSSQGTPLWLLALGGLAIGGGVYYATNKKRKSKKRK